MSTQNFVQADLFRSHEVLHPKLRNGKMAHFADAAPTTDADGGRAVCMDLGLKFDPPPVFYIFVCFGPDFWNQKWPRMGIIINEFRV